MRDGHDATHHHSVISRLGGCPRLRASSGDVLRDGDPGGESGTRGGCRLVGGIQGSRVLAPRSVRSKKRDLSLARNRAVRTLCYGENRYKYFPSAVARGGARPRRPGLVTR